jgi:hypothetical protein
MAQSKNLFYKSLVFMHINYEKVKNSKLEPKNSYACVPLTLESLKVHKIENFFDSDFEICIISLLVMAKY